MDDERVLPLPGRPESVPVARRFVRTLLAEWGLDDAAPDAQLVVSELVGNVVMHAAGGEAVLGVARQADGSVVVSVGDTGPGRPVRRASESTGATGRGLALVHALAADWGVTPHTEGPGKTVWCRLPVGGTGTPAAPVPVHDAAPPPEPLDAAEDGRQRATVAVGDAPTRLLLEAKDHLDAVVRELTLASGGADAGVDAGLPVELVRAVVRALGRFSEARAQLRRLLTDATSRGQDRVPVVLTLPLDLAEAGEDYLRALAAADDFARDTRMLTLESPVEYRVLREWYVQGLVHGLRRAAAGEPPAPWPPFEARLVAALRGLQERARSDDLAARLQRVTARLAAATTLEEMAETTVREATSTLGASGALLTRRHQGRTEALAAAGVETDLIGRYGVHLPARRPAGPSTDVLRTGEPVWVEGRAERDRRYPHLRELQPDVVAFAAVPLRIGSETVAALRVSYTTSHVFSAHERDVLRALAAQAAQAVARQEAEERRAASEQRSAALVALGERLSGSGSTCEALDAVGGFLLPRLGDWAAVHLLTETGRVECVWARHVDPALTAALLQGLRGHEVRTDERVGAGRVIATGRTQLLREVDEAGVRAAAPGDDALVRLLVEEAVTRNGVVVPLVARGDVLGAVSVGRSGDTPLSPEQVADIEDLARRAGPALGVARALETSVRLDLALAGAEIGSFDWVLRSGDMAWDERLRRVLGVGSAEPPTLDRFYAALVPEDRQRVRGMLEQAVLQCGEFRVDARVGRPDGSVRWTECRGRVLRGPDGEPERVVGIALDVTAQRVGHEERLRREREVTERLARVGRAVTAHRDLAQVVQEVTEAATTLTGAQFGAFFYNVLDDAGGAYMLYAIAGVPAEHFTRFPMPRNTEIFAPTFAGEGPVRAADVTVDPRFGRNPPHYGMPDGHLPVHSYLAVPVTLSSGEVAGGLFFGHEERDVFGLDAERMAVGIAGYAAVAIENARLYAAAERQAVARDQVLQALQRPLAPPVLPDVPGLALAAHYAPLGDDVEVGGDFYDVLVLPDGRWLVVLGDVSGKGPEAAAVTGLARPTVWTAAQHTNDPARVLADLNAALFRRGDERFCTAVAAALQPVDGGVEVELVRAGHPPALLVGPDRPTALLGGHGMALGLFPEVALEPVRLRLTRGDALLLHSDGLIERQGRVVTDEELRVAVDRNAAGGRADLSRLVSDLVADLAGAGPVRDDLAVLAVRAV